MGANGSTAVSCSSLDLTNHQNLQQHNRQYRQYRHQNHQANEQRLQKYRKQQVKLSGKNPNCNLKQSNSYFDLSAAPNSSQYFLNNQHRQHPREISDCHRELANEFNGITQCQSPVLVLPSQPSIGIHLGGAKKSNAGVASKILQQRQLQQHQKLKKFSDSMPSLNNILVPQQKTFGTRQQEVPNGHNLAVKMVTNHSNKLYHQNRNSSGSGKLTNSSSQQHALNCAKQIASVSCHNANNNRHDMKLVSEIDENSHAHYQHQYQFHYKQNHHHKHLHKWHSPSNTGDHASNELSTPQHRGQQQQLMKRATSLSSLHNLHDQQHLDYNNLCNARKPIIGSKKHGNHHVAIANGLNPTDTPESMSIVVGNTHNSYDLYNQSHNEHQSPCKQVSSQHYNHQPTPLAKKIHKFKQLANGHSPSRYKSKQQSKSQQQSQQQLQQQQGCQVLPPLPRSQSLHELIQLRATENGQRMRTTGTLRGPLNGSEANNKVNLVAELLENRRQQKLSEDQDITVCDGGTGGVASNRDSAAILSQCSSSDDGIHDISLGGDHQSTSESGRRAEFHPERAGSATKTNDKSLLSVNQDLKSEHKLRVTPKAGSNRDDNTENNHISSTEVKSTNVNGQFKSYDLSSPKSDTPSDEQTTKTTTTATTNQKSTLKRSVSHSALHSNFTGINSMPADVDDVDGDESDDLNELAKFIYQFKQRQENNRAACQKGRAFDNNLASEQIQQNHHRNPQQLLNSSKNAGKQRSNNEITNANSQASLANNLQQSPNSTTSSSGFATCTSNSISSSISDEGNRQQHSKFNEQHELASCKNKNSSNSSKNKKQVPPPTASSQVTKNQSRKKYPAPPRPDENQKIISESQLADAGSSRSQSETAQNVKHLISGKLKLSSSLLSIVDEYNSTLQSASKNSLDQLTGATSGSNLTAVLLSSGKLDYSRDTQANGTSVLSALGEPDDLSGDSVDSPRRRLCQLEHLQRYTQLRQMSQSELALNHLTSMPLGIIQQKRSSGGKSNHNGNSGSSGGSNSNSKQPYKSKLINLIRRISDKSDSHSGGGKNKKLAENPIDLYSGGNSAGGHHQDQGRKIFDEASASNGNNKKRELNGKNQLRAINQNDHVAALITPSSLHSNKSKHLNGKCFNESASGSRNVNSSDNDRRMLTNDGLGGLHGSRSAVNRGNSMALMSESLCDLNFDCDLELIKNCRTSVSCTSSGSGVTNKHNRTNDNLEQPQQQQASKDPPLLQAPANSRKPSFTNDCGSDGKQRLTKQQIKEQQQRQRDSGRVSSSGSKQASVANSSKGENNSNNWRLAPTPFSLASQSTCNSNTSSNYGADPKDQKHRLRHQHSSAQDGKLGKDGRPACPVHTSSGCGGAGEISSAAKQALSGSNVSGSAGGNKLKWPAAGWLMNGGSKNKLKQQQKQLELEQKKKQQKYCSQICLAPTKSISSSETSQSEATGKSALGCEGFASETNIQLALGAVPAKVNSSKQAVADKQQQACKRDGSNNNNTSDISSQADQLLIELDQSLDRVSSSGGVVAACSGEQNRNHQRPPFSRKAALSWWKSTSTTGGDDFNDHQRQNGAAAYEDDVLSRMRKHQQQVSKSHGYNDVDENYDVDDSSLEFNSSEESSAINGRRNFRRSYGNNNDDSEDDDGGDYASLNRAMINETFGVEPNQVSSDKNMITKFDSSNDGDNSAIAAASLQQKRPDSPSDSFTFSIPSSPVPSIMDACGSEDKKVDGANVIGSSQLHRANVMEPFGSGMETAMVITQQGKRVVETKRVCNFDPKESESAACFRTNRLNNAIESNHVILNSQVSSDSVSIASTITANKNNNLSNCRVNTTNESENPSPVISSPLNGRHATTNGGCSYSNAGINCISGRLDVVNINEGDSSRHQVMLHPDDMGKHCNSHEGENAHLKVYQDNNCTPVRHHEPLIPSDGSNNGNGKNNMNCNNKQLVQIKKHEGGAMGNSRQVQHCCDTTKLSQQPTTVELHPTHNGRNLDNARGCCQSTNKCETSMLVTPDQLRRKSSGELVNGGVKGRGCRSCCCNGSCDNDYNPQSHLIDCKSDGQSKCSSNGCSKRKQQLEGTPSTPSSGLDFCSHHNHHCCNGASQSETREKVSMADATNRKGSVSGGPLFVAKSQCHMSEVAAAEGRGSNGSGCFQGAAENRFSCNQNYTVCCLQQGVTVASEKENCQMMKRASEHKQCNGIHRCNSFMAADNSLSSARQTTFRSDDAFSSHNGRLAKDNSSEIRTCQGNVAFGKCCSIDASAHVNGYVESVEKNGPRKVGSSVRPSRDLHDNGGNSARGIERAASGSSGTMDCKMSAKPNNKLIIHSGPCHCSSVANDGAAATIGGTDEKQQVGSPVVARFGGQRKEAPMKYPAKCTVGKFKSEQSLACRSGNGKKVAVKTTNSATGRDAEVDVVSAMIDGGFDAIQQSCTRECEDSCCKINGDRLIHQPQLDAELEERNEGAVTPACSPQRPVIISHSDKLSTAKNSHLNHLKQNSRLPASHHQDSDLLVSPSEYNEDIMMENYSRDKLSYPKGVGCGEIDVNDGNDAVLDSNSHLSQRNTGSILPGSHNHPSCGITGVVSPDQMSACESPVASTKLNSPNGGRLLQGATRLIKSKLSIINPICRSNSELVSAYNLSNNKSKINGSKKGGALNGYCKGDVGEAQKGKLSNSAVQKDRELSRTKLAHCKTSKLASSQISLVNYYSGYHLNPEQLLGTNSKKFNDGTYKVKQPDGQERDFDDNFILKRKTPNAGLKSHC